MRLLFHVRWLLTLVLGLGNLLAAHATHVKGGNITYTSIASTTAGVPRYHVVVQLFLDPVILQQTVVTLQASNGACGATTNSFTVDINKSQELTGENQFCTTQAVSGRYNVSIYETDLDLPTGQWTLNAILENRVDGVVNCANSVSTSFAVSSFIDNTLVTQDASPKFESVLLPYFDGNTIPPYSFSAFDTDADSLRYEFIPSQMVPGGLAGGLAGNCSQAVTGFQLAPHFTLNSSTGALAPATPSSRQGYYITAVRVSEYRRLAGQWRLIGYVTRDFTYLTYASTNQPPTFTSVAINGGAARPLGSIIAARPGQTVQLTLTAADPDAGQQLRFSTYATNVVPGLRLTTLGATQVQLTWQVPATLPAGRYAIPVAVVDDGCSYNASEDRTLVFSISNQTLAGRPALNAEHEVYPVPFRDQVQFRAAPNQAVTLLDALGRTVAQLTSAADGRVVWRPAAGLPAGLYLARSADGQPLARLLHAAD